MISSHLDSNNLHHAYLIEGMRDQIVPEILKFLKTLNIKTLSNPDFTEISVDSLKIDDARNLLSHSMQKSFSAQKRIFIISANNFLLEAQNSLLKLFEEPIENTYFFVITPDASGLLKTLVSRFYFISDSKDLEVEEKDAEKFIKMPLKARLDFIKELLAQEEDEEEIIQTDSPRSKALKFLNALESTLHKQMSRLNLDIGVFEHFFKIREFLRMPGSSAKTLMESVALIIPNLKS